MQKHVAHERRVCFEAARYKRNAGQLRVRTATTRAEGTGMSGPADTTRRVGWSKGPCPGCHTGTNHPSGGVCHRCAELIKHGQRDAEARAVAAKGAELFRIPWAHHELPYIPHGAKGIS